MLIVIDTFNLSSRKTDKRLCRFVDINLLHIHSSCFSLGFYFSPQNPELVALDYI